jgi:hypothetical protein
MTHPKPHRIVMLAREALSGAWLPEDAIAQYVARHEPTAVSRQALTAILQQLQHDGVAESVTYPGHRTRHWRRVAAGRIG